MTNAILTNTKETFDYKKPKITDLMTKVAVASSFDHVSVAKGTILKKLNPFVGA